MNPLHLLSAGFVSLLVATQGFAAKSSPAPLTLVQENKALAVIVIPATPNPIEKEAADKLHHYLLKATGVSLPIVNEGTAEEKAAKQTKIWIGKTNALSKEGIDPATLPDESYGVKITKGAIFLYGKDNNTWRDTLVPQSVSKRPDYVNGQHWSAHRAPGTKWAVNAFAEKLLGVRWLWPGEVGTYIPRHTTVTAEPVETLTRPRLERRVYMAKSRLLNSTNEPWQLLDGTTRKKLKTETLDWLESHHAGSRIDLFYGHSFAHWWDKYSSAQPDLFAVPPTPDIQHPFPRHDRVKLRLSNPAVLDVIEKEYLEAGKPARWAVTPNDGSGFDTSPETMAWDKPANQDKMTIWRAKGYLTERYVHFWNLVYERLKKHNPDVKLSVLAYSCYRKPPLPETEVKAKLILGIVNNFKGHGAYDSWKGWSSRGAEMFLRPNWWHLGAHSPYLEPLAQGKYVKFAAENGMIAFSADSILGYWSTQGINYYVVARLIANPDLEPEAVIDEYCSAFGPAKEKIRAYLDYWMENSQKVNFAGAEGQHSAETGAGSGEYNAIAKKYGLKSVLTGSFRAIPLLYKDALFEVPLRLLEEARELAKTDPDALKRVEFLQQGLREYLLTKQVLELGYAIKENGQSRLWKEFEAKANELKALRTELTKEHVIWGDSVYENEMRRKIPTTVSVLPESAGNMDGL